MPRRGAFPWERAASVPCQGSAGTNTVPVLPVPQPSPAQAVRGVPGAAHPSPPQNLPQGLVPTQTPKQRQGKGSSHQVFTRIFGGETLN